MTTAVLISLALLAAPGAASPSTAATASPVASTSSAEAPSTARQGEEMPPEVKRAVDAMQKFYEETTHFEADFVQTYTYSTFARQTKSTGTLRFLKSGASMRWDYKTPTEKSFVVAAGRYFVYDKEAKQIVVAQMESDRSSASLSFLWGQGRIDQEFVVKAARREEFQDGVALELTPRVHDPRFERIYLLLDGKKYSVKETLVVDPDGSENHMVLSNVRTDGTFGKEAFKLQPPSDVQVVRFDQPAPKAADK